MHQPTRSTTARDERLEIWFEIAPGARMDRTPTRAVILHFKNISGEPVRIYLPRAEQFRAGISGLVFSGSGDTPPLFVPEPRPHGYRVTEDDFPLIAPGEERTFEQTFTLDPLAREGPGTERLKGFLPGTTARVGWTYENSIVRWRGGAATLDGPTAELFEGKDIPHIWTGKLSVEASWTVP